MPGAADLVVRGALAAGASMIRLSSRGDVAELVDLPAEVVRSEDSKFEKRSRCVVAGPGVGTDGVDWLGERLIDCLLYTSCATSDAGWTPVWRSRSSSSPKA